MTTRTVTIRSKSGSNPCTTSSNLPITALPSLSKPTKKASGKPKPQQPRAAGPPNGKKPKSSTKPQSSLKAAVSGHPIQAPPQRPSSSAPATPQQRRTVMPVKVRRMERRKDIVSMTDALQSAQVDLLSTSPPTSSAESEDSDAQNKRKPQRRQHANRRSTQQPPAPSAFPPLQKKSANLRSRRRSSSAVDVRSQVYAGPTFSNAPAPSALPIPAFTSPEPARHRTVSLNLHLQPEEEDIFIMDPLPHLQQQSIELMNLLTPTLPRHPFPAKLRTSHDFNNDQMLSEIQRGLRSMLKIEA
ncbi:hypothetical protein CLU79DRAFT_719271 [Phycomyces nitens]|nr:hypothetical protein CLU79DRAFT_719271 [Phycomyces nitens]